MNWRGDGWLTPFGSSQRSTCCWLGSLFLSATVDESSVSCRYPAPVNQWLKEGLGSSIFAAIPGFTMEAKVHALVSHSTIVLHHVVGETYQPCFNATRSGCDAEVLGGQ